MKTMPMTQTAIVDYLKRELPVLLAVYAFGSRVRGVATSESDLDLAVLAECPLEPLRLWDIAQDLASLLELEVDLIDLRRASTVLQYQVVTTGQCWWAVDAQAALFECFVLSEKTALDEARAARLADIGRSGTVYGG